MAKPNPFRVINAEENDPELERRKDLCRRVISDMLQKVDDEDVQSICFVAVTNSGDIIHGRSVETDFHSILGGLNRQAYVVNQLLDGVNVNSSEQEY
ncbi:hypothetical protein [Atlantibacter sp.]|uniref:hypothetical protein n=1 Tax=Atlantibacter sp. TaxID=1903473 RepID=UPI0028ADC521|nr:hypothetical protein [Atlantibacter sp.]